MLLANLGFAPEAAPSHVVTSRALSGGIPAPTPPDGFTLRSVTGVHEAAALAAVHNGSFTPK